VRRVRSEARELSCLRRAVGGLSCERVAPDLLKIEVPRCAGDGLLHGVVERLVAAGAEIVSADTKRLGLKEIMEEIECEGAEA